MSFADDFHKSLNDTIKKLDDIMTDFDYLDYQIGQEIDLLSEMRGDMNERAEKVGQAIDLNREILNHKEPGDKPLEGTPSGLVETEKAEGKPQAAPCAGPPPTFKTPILEEGKPKE